MIVNLIDAHKYFCCADPNKKCSGNTCMAWRTQFVTEKRTSSFLPRGVPSMPPKPIATDKGYCGLVYIK